MTNRLFEVQPDGTLAEVSDVKRTGRRFSTRNETIDVLWTAEEEAARDAEEKASAEAAAADARALEQRASSLAAARNDAIAKLKVLGLTDEEINAIVS